MRTRPRKNNSWPLAYKFGGAWFCELPFYVNRHVLIPRFDTELLAEAAILGLEEGAKVLEIGVGSGAVAVTLARHGFRVTGTDISRRALSVARRNARLHEVDIEFIKSDLFGARKLVGRKFDAIVCNPPYIMTSEIGAFDKSTLAEPRLALDGGKDGLNFYREISLFAGDFLVPGGQIFFEIDFRAGENVKKILRDCGFCDIVIRRDKQGHERVINGIFRAN